MQTGNLKAVFSPATTGLIADTVVSGAITIEIAFLALDGFDQFCLEEIVVLHAVRFGNSPDLRDFHSSSPFSFLATRGQL